MTTPETTSADRLAIMELCSRFETTFDRGELDAHMTMWADELFFTSPYMGEFSTRAAYRAGLQKFYDELKEKGGTRHLMTNFEFDELGASTARVRSYLSVFQRKSGQMLGIVEWQDRLVRTDSGWKFTERRQVP